MSSHVSDHHIDFSAPPSDVTVVHEFLEHVWQTESSVTHQERVAFELALIELSSNVITHADSGAGVSCRLVLHIDDDAITARLSDTGEPGDIVLSERAMPDPMAESGRGLALVQMIVDDLSYERDGASNVWRIRLDRQSSF